MSVYHAENFGTHYARTLHEWRARYRRQLDRVRALGFSERFIRMWDLYLRSARRPSSSATPVSFSWS